jgi:sterol desaturase/sphingolipid hydroxylase (fatty acid hydroxylase superfamily)
MLNNELYIRLGLFIGVLLLMALLETLFPKRARRFDRLVRWPGNFLVLMMDSFALQLLLPVTAVGFALFCSQQQFGLLNQLPMPYPLSVVITMLLLDLTIYAQHVVFHRVPILWRLHRMHHTDLDLDVTSGTRFHPLEILLSMLIKLTAIWVIGAPAVAVMLFEVLLNAGAMFNHANLRIPSGLDGALRLLVVTPDMHRVHHSAIPAETNSNFGFNLPWWDRLFGTYIAQPELGHNDMTIGLAEFQDIDTQRIDKMLVQPWEKIS